MNVKPFVKRFSPRIAHYYNFCFNAFLQSFNGNAKRKSKYEESKMTFSSLIKNERVQNFVEVSYLTFI